MMENIPVVGGVLALVTDPEDMKAKAFYILGGLLLIAMVFESLGYTLGPLGAQVVSAFPIVLAYIIGQKQGENSV